MSITLANVQAKIVETENAISAATAAASYGKGDKQVSRQQIADLQRILYSLRRDERQLTAANNGAHNPGIMTASWNRNV